MSTPSNKQSSNSRGIKAEVRQIREATEKVTASKEAARQFLASTKMYTAHGRLKPQFG
jgi:hypothetical protein